MPNAQRTTTINRSPAEIFSFLAEGLNAPKRRSGVLEIAHKSGDGQGAIYRQVVSGPGGRKVDADYEVTDCHPPRRLAFKAIAGPVRPTGSYELEDAGAQTRLTFSLSADLGGWRKLLLGWPVQRTMEAEMTALDRLKSVLEAWTV